MMRKRFPLSSDQLELLLAFESSGSLQNLAENMAKDPSVVSRNLQHLAELSPVIVKVKGRWQISPLGSQINELTTAYLKSLNELSVIKNQRADESGFSNLDRTALLIINAQRGLLNPTLGNRSNSNAETNIRKLLNKWRAGTYPVIHVRHASNNPESLFFTKAKGFEFISDLKPEKDELILEKAKASAFADTTLFDELNARQIESLVITGFTANECIDATARQAGELGFDTYVVADASASFDITGYDGKLYRADRIHKLTMVNLHALYAKVITIEDLLKEL